MKICSFFRKKISYYVELFLVFCFVLSTALNVKFYLDNEVLKEVVALETGAQKEQVQTIVDNLHEVNKINDTNASDKNESVLTKEQKCN